MGPYFAGKKSNLTGLCEILNNFDLKFQKISQKRKNLSMTGHISGHRIRISNFCLFYVFLLLLFVAILAEDIKKILSIKDKTNDRICDSMQMQAKNCKL